MRIALVVWDLTVSGGTQRQAMELARRLEGHDVTVYAYAFDAERCYPEVTRSLDIRFVTKEAPTRPTAPGPAGRALETARSKFRAFEREVHALAGLMDESVDVVNAHDIHTEKVAYRYRERFPDVPVVWMSNDPPLVFQSYDHHLVRPRVEPGRARWAVRWALRHTAWRVERRRERRFLRAVDEIVVLDERNRRSFQRHAGRDARVIRSGLDVARFEPRYEKTNPVFTLLGTGILFPLRRFEDAIDAVAVLRERRCGVRLDIIGTDRLDPGYSSALRRRVEEGRLGDAVTFLGAVSEPELRKRYAAADAFVFPNHNQTWGLAVFEALASGTPAIVSRTAGASEVLRDGETALLVDPLRPDQIADAVERLRADRDLYARLQRQGRAFVEERITWDRYAAEMEERLLQAASA